MGAVDAQTIAHPTMATVVPAMIAVFPGLAFMNAQPSASAFAGASRASFVALTSALSSQLLSLFASLAISCC